MELFRVFVHLLPSSHSFGAFFRSLHGSISNSSSLFFLNFLIIKTTSTSTTEHTTEQHF